NEANWQVANATGAGDVVVTSHLTFSYVPGAAGGAAFRGTRRLVNRAKATFSTNSTISFLDRSSFRNEGFLTFQPGTAIYSFQAAAPHPDVAVLNLRSIFSQSNVTFGIRMTNSGSLQVSGSLRLQDQNSVQIAGSTLVNGTL